MRGHHVGYMDRDVAAMLAPELARLRCTGYTCCGLVRGGGGSARTMAVHVWLDRRCAPGPPVVFEGRPDHEVGWPPWEGEGEPDVVWPTDGHERAPRPRKCPGCGKTPEVPPRVLVDGGRRVTYRCFACEHEFTPRLKAERTRS